MFWRPSVKEISDWVEDTYLKFAEQENKDPHRSSDEFLQRLVEIRTNFQEVQSPAWTPERINILKRVNNAVSRVVDFWTTQTLEAFVTEFTIDTHTYFSEVERQFFKGPRGKYLNSLSLKIKMLLDEKGIFLIESDCYICCY